MSVITSESRKARNAENNTQESVGEREKMICTVHEQARTSDFLRCARKSSSLYFAVNI